MASDLIPDPDLETEVLLEEELLLRMANPEIDLSRDLPMERQERDP